MMFERLQNVASWSHLEVMREVVIGDVDKRLSNFLSELKTSYRGVYQTLYVVDNQNMIAASSDASQIGKSAASIPQWMQIQFAGQSIFLAKLQNKPNSQQQLLPIATDIVDADNQKIGSLWVVFDWNYILNILKNTENKGSAAALLEAGNHHAKKNHQYNLDMPLTYTENWQKILSAYEISAYSDATNLVNPPIFNWQVAITQYRAVAMAPVQRMGYIFLFLLAATAVLTTILATPFARRITMPLAQLTEYAHRFMRSSQATLPPADGPAEIQAMSNAFGKMMEDLTVSKDNLTRAAKLAVAGEMAAAMSHEVRTPLGILRSSAQVLSREKNLSAEGLEVAGFITTETERLNKLVSTLVDSARPRQPEFAMHDIVALAEHAVAMLRMQAHKKEIGLVFSYGNNLSESVLEIAPNAIPKKILVECDGEQITQVMLNLLLNAIQVLPVGGKVEVTLSESPDSVIISVADNGSGVDVTQKEQIFDPFFTQRPGGIGLGLAVSRQIVIAHFGSLKVEASNLPSFKQAPHISEQAEYGADFKVTLPKLQLR
jgi:signal transduction histidine kinase